MCLLAGPGNKTGKKASPQTILTDEERAMRAKKAKDSSTRKELWEAAYDKIDKQRLDRLQRQINDGDETAPEELQDVLRNGEVLQIRDGAMKVIKTILSYKDIVTAAVAAETRASLAWGGITALLTVSSFPSEIKKKTEKVAL
ncbi:hypothetical protein N7493_000658 [Penicillium malachiteum]|uniref:NWD NACHT-NTPase N-terminal domain-containing protein n=1 Tax=Penicillium malachiteum TaxID=1324776 RepID=A0AAD6N119_9EURO|nr:hypothetical protein N7493_000658 [Penicillium malachiteum]